MERELLKKLRGHMAYKKGVEPFRVFRDVELELLLQVKPKTIKELTTIKGFPAGGKRVEGYGEAIIAIFNKPQEIKDFNINLDKDGEPTAKIVLKQMSVF